MEIDEFFSRLHDPGNWDAGTVAAILAHRDAEASARPGPPAVTEVAELTIERPTVLDCTHHIAGDLRLDSHLLVLGDLRVGNLILGTPAHHILMVAGTSRAACWNSAARTCWSPAPSAPANASSSAPTVRR